jgi:hypothetical protein
VQTVAPTEDETLQNEADNQENVLSQVGWPVLGPPLLPWRVARARGWSRVKCLGAAVFSVHSQLEGYLLFVYQEYVLNGKVMGLFSRSWGLSRLPSQRKGKPPHSP